MACHSEIEELAVKAGMEHMQAYWRLRSMEHAVQGRVKTKKEAKAELIAYGMNEHIVKSMVKNW